MIRDTSIAAYREIKANGLLKKLNFSVYEAVVKMKSASIRMIYDEFFIETHNDRSISSRFSELEKRGVIRAAGKKPCKVTGKTVYYWEATGELPHKWEPPQREVCRTCGGKGFIETQQGKFDV